MTGTDEPPLPLHFRRVGDGVVVIRPRVPRDTGSLNFFGQIATANLSSGRITPWRDHVLSDAERVEIETWLAAAAQRKEAVDRQAAFRLVEDIERVRRLVWDGAWDDDPALLEALVVACLDLRDTIARRPERDPERTPGEGRPSAVSADPAR